jgi:hypothetical protein
MMQINDANCLPGSPEKPPELSTAFDEMLKAIRANCPAFRVIEGPPGSFYPLFPGGGFCCHDHPYLGDAVNEAYLLLKRVVHLECSVMELNNHRRTDIL